MLRRLYTLGAIAVLIGLFAAALSSASLLNGIAWGTFRIFVAAASAAILLWVIFHATAIEPPQATGRSVSLPPTNHELAQAYYNAVSTYSERTLSLFIKMMIDLPYYLERISERVVLEEEIPQMEISTHQNYRVGLISPGASTEPGPAESSAPVESSDPAGPPGPAEPLLIPIVYVRKGILLDGFTVNDASHCSLSTLSYNQTRGLLAYTIETVIDIAPEGTNDITNGERLETKKRVTAKLVEAVCSPGPLRKQSDEDRRRIRELLNSTDDLPIEREWRERIKNFCTKLVDHYIIVTEVSPPAGPHVSVTYRQRIPLESSAMRFANRMRSRFGLRYSIIDIPLNMFAVHCETYHLQMDAGPMQYVFDHHLEWLKTGERLTQDELNDGNLRPYIRMHHDSAEPAMHLYIRRQSVPTESSASETEARDALDPSALADRRLKSVVEFREIPPGALGAATMVSWMTAVIISFFALTQIGQQPVNIPSMGTVASDIPALLIAVPGIASLLIGSWLDLSRLRRASLTTYIGLGASAILSFSSALYFLLVEYRTVPGHVVLSVSSNINVRTDVGWLILSFLAVTCCLFLSNDVVYSSRYYFQVVKRRVARRMEE